MPRHSDQGFGAGVDLADLDGRDSGVVESVAKSISCWRGNQQASGGLGVEQKGTHVVGNGVAVFNQAFGKVAIVLEAGGDVSGADVFQRAFQEGNAAGIDGDRHVGS